MSSCRFDNPDAPGRRRGHGHPAVPRILPRLVNIEPAGQGSGVIFS